MLSIVGTPIGNLGDITERAKDVLEESDLVFCEDTRVTGKLLSALGIGHNGRLRRLDENLLSGNGAQAVIEALDAGMRIAYCTDAGMPGISDPGQRLVAAVRDADYCVQAVPGPSAVDCAMAVSGIQSSSWYFGGFLPRKEGDRKRLLDELSKLDSALVFYESPKRIGSAVESIAAFFPHRKIAICRELTKLHEEVMAGSPDHVADLLDGHRDVKGEIVLVISPPTEFERHEASKAVIRKAEEAASVLLSEGVSRKTLSTLLQKIFGISRNDAYEVANSAGRAKR